MERLSDHTHIRQSAPKGAVVAIGNFDGVHLGHRAVIDQARAIALCQNAPLGVMTFEPHPREFFAPNDTPFRLMSTNARAHRLEKIGVEVLFELPFDHTLANLTANDFCQQILHDTCGVSHVVVGQDFCFGKGRKGTVEILHDAGARLGFGVTIATLKDLGDEVISSTNIRNALGAGNPRKAAQMLGHWHRIESQVIQGDQRGRDLGFPTANMSIDGLLSPKFGIYAGLVDVLTGPHQGSYQGAISIGTRPTFGENKPNLEVYLFDFNGDLYGETLSVGLVEYLRGEEKFDNLDALISQMHKDCDQARLILASL